MDDGTEPTDPNPWFCTLCGRMSSPNHIGRLHSIALFDSQAETKYMPRSAIQVIFNPEERSDTVMAAHENLRRKR